MAGDTVVNHQNWSGMSSAEYGYGAMRRGFRDAVLADVQFNVLASVAVFMGLPDSCPGFWDGAHRVLATMWETDGMPESWIPFLSEFDQIVVPCKHNRELFSKYHPIVSVVPLGFDPSVWHPRFREANKRFRFHAGGSLWGRKGLDLVLQAFLELGLDAELHLKVAPHCKDMPEFADRDNVVVCRGWMSESELVGWVQQADCWVAPSRGEGFGLMPLQAMACGVPTIVSDTSGHREFQHFATSVVPTSPVTALQGGSWNEPDLELLKQAMLEVYENATQARTEALSRVADICQFSWVNASQRLLEAIPVGVLLPEGTRFIPVDPMVTVTTNRTFSTDVAGRRFHMVQGQPQTVPYGVKEVLQQAGYLIV